MAERNEAGGVYYIFRAWVIGKNGEKIFPIPPKKALRIPIVPSREPKKKN